LLFTTNGERPISGFGHARERLAAAMLALRKAELLAAGNAKEAAGAAIEHFTIHDLRRTAATGMARIGVAHHVLDRVLIIPAARSAALPGSTTGMTTARSARKRLKHGRGMSRAWCGRLRLMSCRSSPVCVMAKRHVDSDAPASAITVVQAPPAPRTEYEALSDLYAGRSSLPLLDLMTLALDVVALLATTQPACDDEVSRVLRFPGGATWVDAKYEGAAERAKQAGVTRPVQTMRDAYLAHAARGELTAAMSIKDRYRLVLRSAIVQRYIQDTQKRVGLGKTPSPTKSSTRFGPGKPELS
jgi:hypothetical protein